jgi:hypothetical protein
MEMNIKEEPEDLMKKEESEDDLNKPD